MNFFFLPLGEILLYLWLSIWGTFFLVHFISFMGLHPMSTLGYENKIYFWELQTKKKKKLIKSCGLLINNLSNLFSPQLTLGESMTYRVLMLHLSQVVHWENIIKLFSMAGDLRNWYCMNIKYAWMFPIL